MKKRKGIKGKYCRFCEKTLKAGEKRECQPCKDTYHLNLKKCEICKRTTQKAYKTLCNRCEHGYFNTKQKS